jgi:hypothetical protein
LYDGTVRDDVWRSKPQKLPESEKTSLVSTDLFDKNNAVPGLRETLTVREIRIFDGDDDDPLFVYAVGAVTAR